MMFANQGRAEPAFGVKASLLTTPLVNTSLDHAVPPDDAAQLGDSVVPLRQRQQDILSFGQACLGKGLLDPPDGFLKDGVIPAAPHQRSREPTRPAPVRGRRSCAYFS